MVDEKEQNVDTESPEKFSFDDDSDFETLLNSSDIKTINFSDNISGSDLEMGVEDIGDAFQDETESELEKLPVASSQSKSDNIIDADKLPAEDIEPQNDILEIAEEPRLEIMQSSDDNPIVEEYEPKSSFALEFKDDDFDINRDNNVISNDFVASKPESNVKSDVGYNDNFDIHLDWYSGELTDKTYEVSLEKMPEFLDPNKDIKVVHVNVASGYGWNVFFDNGVFMNLRDLREYQERHASIPCPSGKIIYGNKTTTFDGIERIVIFEKPRYFSYQIR
jgi:hypothetical protein